VNGHTTRLAWDDEDRLTSMTYPDGHSDTFSYTGLGLRLRKNDPTGAYWYDTDGVSPASDVLSDGYVSFTPGISEINGAGSRFYLPDAQGNSRGLLDGGQVNTDGYNWDAFGNSVSRFGVNPTAFAWGGGSGYQSDNDSGLKLLGHRYYDTRIGRFLSQDPVHAGGNWYEYAGNNPVNATDPLGLLALPFQDPAGTSLQQMIQDTVANGGLPGEKYDVKVRGEVVNTFTIPEQIGFNHIIPGYNVTAVFNAARLFAQTPLRGGRGGGHLPNYYDKEGYIYQHFYTNTGGDPKRVLVGLGNNPLYRFYDDVGNYGFGAMLAGLGFDVKDAKAKAGAFQGLQAFRLNGLRGLMDNISNNGLYPFGGRNGDDARGAQMIQQGFNDYSNR